MAENKKGNIIFNIKNIYIIKVTFECLKKNKFFTIIKYSKKIQKLCNIDLETYKKFAKIEIELELIKSYDINNPFELSSSNFIHIIDDEKKHYYHIIFDNDYNKDIQKITIVIDYNIDSLCGLFKDCKNINKINFTKFYRKDIVDMSYMFYECSDLTDLDISNIYTDNVQDMRAMFFRCSSLKKLNLSKFKTNNVKDMSNMFYECCSLTELNLSNFNTKNVCHMNNMFYKCCLLKELNLSSFNTENTNYMIDMFCDCLSLKDLNISNFNFTNGKSMNHMFANCSEELKEKIRRKNKNIKNEAFQ